MYRVAFRSSARSAFLVRQSPRWFSSSPFDSGTPPPPPPSPPPTPPGGKLGRKKLAEGESNLNTSDMIENLSHKLGLPKSTCKLVVSATFDFIGAAMANRKPVKITGFGTFQAKESNAKAWRHPRTQEKLEIPAKWRPKFHASKSILTKWVETGVKPTVKSADTEE